MLTHALEFLLQLCHVIAVRDLEVKNQDNQFGTQQFAGFVVPMASI